MHDHRLLTRDRSQGRWMPKSISYAFGEPIVELARIGTPPRFFSDLDVRGAVATVRRPLMDVAIAEDAGDLAPAGFLFHLPRSGSTLAARMFAVPDSCATLVEPEAFNALLSSPEAIGRVKPDWLRRLCRLYCAGFADSCRRVFVKLSSWAVLSEPIFAEAFPDVPGCFVHRSPVEVMVQLLRRPVGWMSDRARPFILGPHEPAASMSIEEYCARAIERFCDAALRGAPRVRAVAYEQLPDVVPEVVADHFGVEIGEAERRTMLDLARFDSEDWSLARPYRATPGELAAGATATIQAYAERFADEPRRRLLEPSRRSG
jgi:hypothetical protein